MYRMFDVGSCAAAGVVVKKLPPNPDLDIPPKPPLYTVGPTKEEHDSYYSVGWLWLGVFPWRPFREWYGYDPEQPRLARTYFEQEATRALK